MSSSLLVVGASFLNSKSVHRRHHLEFVHKQITGSAEVFENIVRTHLYDGK